MLDPVLTSSPTLDLGQVASQAVNAVQSHNWTMLAGVVVMILVYIVRQTSLMSKLPSKYVPWVTIGMTTAGSMATSLVAGRSMWDAVGAGLMLGCSAIATWELAGQHAADKIEAPKANV